MAFGKDLTGLRNTGSFRQRAGQHEHNRDENRSSSKGATPYFVGQFKPPTEYAATIRLIEGHYEVDEAHATKDRDDKGNIIYAVDKVDLPYYPWVEHFDGRNQKSSICSAGALAMDKHRRLPCHGCDTHWATREPGPDGRKKSGRMSRADKYSFSLIDYGKYHKLPQIDRQTGQIRRADDGTPYMNWSPCIGVGCDGCKSNAESMPGQTVHWSLGYGHYQTLLSTDAEIGKSCANCGSVNSIQGRAWVCPQCGEAAIDLATTNLKRDEVSAVTDRHYHCNCGYNGFLMELIECTTCSPVGGKPRRATLFDVDMEVKRVKTATGQGEQTALSVVRFSQPRPVAHGFEQLNKPKDLPKIFLPTPLEMQASLFGVSPNQQRQPRTAADISSSPNPAQQMPQQPQFPQAPGFTPPSGFSPPPGMPAQQGFFRQPTTPPQSAPQPQQHPGFGPTPGSGFPIGAPPGTPWGFPPKQ